jgi:hypothetical protein
MKDVDKLRVLLPHWIEHNHGHGAEFFRWAETLAVDAPEIAGLLRRSAEALQSAHRSLEEALHRAGGPLTAPGHDTSSQHHHHS